VLADGSTPSEVPLADAVQVLDRCEIVTKGIALEPAVEVEQELSVVSAEPAAVSPRRAVGVSAPDDLARATVRGVGHAGDDNPLIGCFVDAGDAGDKLVARFISEFDAVEIEPVEETAPMRLHSPRGGREWRLVGSDLWIFERCHPPAAGLEVEWRDG
jgi:hypothetical protein